MVRPAQIASNSRGGFPRPAQIFDPVASALEVIGDRWTLVLIRQLLSGPKGFQELRMRTGIAPRVLSGRLRRLSQEGFVEQIVDGSRTAYSVADLGRSLEPIVASIARWWVRHALEDTAIDPGRFTETSAQSVIESLPFLLHEERAHDAQVTFEIRLTGEGGGVWTVRIFRGQCEVQADFAAHADVRYTADARTWCAVALGLLEAREAIQHGRLTKDGGRQAMDHYFHQVVAPARSTPRVTGTEPNDPGNEPDAKI